MHLAAAMDYDSIKTLKWRLKQLIEAFEGTSDPELQELIVRQLKDALQNAELHARLSDPPAA